MGIVKNFGGDIQVSSELEQGTKITISLPLKGILHE
jgi:signal transduction histidine kinase